MTTCLGKYQVFYMDKTGLTDFLRLRFGLLDSRNTNLWLRIEVSGLLYGKCFFFNVKMYLFTYKLYNCIHTYKKQIL